MARQDDIKRLLSVNNRRLQLLKEQKATHGVSVQPQIIIEIENIEADIEELEAELKELKLTFERMEKRLETGAAAPPTINNRIPKSKDRSLDRWLTALIGGALSALFLTGVFWPGEFGRYMGVALLAFTVGFLLISLYS